MKRIVKLGSLVLVFALAGCSVLTAIGNWLPFGISVLDGVVAIAAPANTKIAADAGASQKVFNDLDAAVAAAQAAGSGLTGLNKVIAEVSSGISGSTVILGDISALGVTMNAKDASFVTAGENLLIAALQGFEAELKAQGATLPPGATAMREIKGGCFGFEPATKASGPHIWANCDASDPIDYTWDADPQTGKPVAAPAASGKKAPKLGSFKRQYNALCTKYGHPEKQIHLTMAEHLHLR